MTICLEGDCRLAATTRGFCTKHYKGRHRRGEIAPSRNRPGSGLAFLTEHLDDEDTGECLIWPFHRNKENGYGCAKREGKSIGAHRYMCILAHGDPPFPKAEAAHSCGKGHEGCVHPRHLRWSTKPENHADKIEHGTDNRGEKHYKTGLTSEQVLAIVADPRPAPLVAADHQTAVHTVYNIRLGVSWAWLTGIVRKAA